ncbi:MAG TPA: D-alanine--D-alanine ligase family protein [Oscillospiraceae bacterium]|nr:D-alanine--D-alanine ligase family protein [Oscillospiraceae bacterium]
MKKKIAVLYGGRSGEHEVSLRSAAAIMEGLKNLPDIEVLPVFITKEGSWQLNGSLVTVLPDPDINGLYILDGERAGNTVTIDVIFPALHGTYGEDGTVQGLLELVRIPYVGAGVAGSAVGMDKILMKAALVAAGLPVGDYLWFTAYQWHQEQAHWLAAVEEKLGFPCFIKPANLGSSVGISKAYNQQELRHAIEVALQYDRRVIVEKFLTGQEIECSVLGNDDPQASLPGEIIPSNDFYDYRAKYIDDRSRIVIPAQLKPDTITKVRQLAVETFTTLDCAGLARVDLFVNEQTGEIWLNEINTMPGFTTISMYPKMWEASGLPFAELLQQLIQLAEERFQQKEALKTSFELDE